MGIGAHVRTMSEDGLNKEDLEELGRMLDLRPARLRGRTVGMTLAEHLLRVRTRDGRAMRRNGSLSGGGDGATLC